MEVGFNKPYIAGAEYDYITDAVNLRHLSGSGKYTLACQKALEEKYNFKRCFLTTSCTDALEMAAILIDIQPGDEVIIPAYTFVSTANAFVLRGANIIFADSSENAPNIDADSLESLITSKTKAIVPVHYAGVPCNMEHIMALAVNYNLFVIEDAAQAIDSYLGDRPLGSFGHFATFSFHETKNIQCGEGGMLVVNDERFIKRAEIIRDKGTNRSAFFRGEINKYQWVDLGSSFLPSDLTAAFLFAQIQQLEFIQSERKKIWYAYFDNLIDLSRMGHFKLPNRDGNSNAHMFYLVCSTALERNRLIEYLRDKQINAVFHYLSLHSSPYYIDKHDGRELPWSDYYSERLLRLPFWIGMKDSISYITDSIRQFFLNENGNNRGV